MKFAEHLSAHLTPEWRKQYVEYEALKDILYKALDDFEILPVVNAVTVGKHFNMCDTVFFAMCQAELDKVNNFFSEKLAESKRKFAALKDECDRHLSTKLRAPIASIYLKSPAAVIDDGSGQARSLCSTVVGTPECSRNTDRRISDMNMLRLRRNTLRLKKDEKRFDHPSGQVGQNEETPRLKAYDLKLALSEFYLSLVLLQNYQSLNFIGFRKILKKHDKLFQRTNGLEWYRDVITKEPFHMDDSVDAMITEVEDIVTKLEGGDRQRAMKRLRVPPLAAQASGKSIFRFGLFLGIFICELLCILLVAGFAKVPQFSYPAFRLFRGSFLITYYICMIGVNVYGWRSSGVNHVLIFEIDPRSHLNQFQLMEGGMFLAGFWGAAMLLYQFSDLIQVPGYVSPLVLCVAMIAFLFLPIHVFHMKSRFWLIKILYRIIRAPLTRVRFPDFFIADQLNSLSFILPDLAYFFCFFVNFIDNHMMIKSALRNSTISSNNASQLFSPKAGFCDGMMWGLQPILKALPAWWRFLQCLRRYHDLTIKSPVPHLMNAGKYSTTLISYVCSVMTSVNPHMVFFVLMVLAKLFASVCTTTWDLVMDWGLLDRSSKDNLFLRDELVYRFRAYYYVAIVEDVIIRFAWILPLVFSHFRIVDFDIITTIVMFAEVNRRIIWNFFRLENEHLNNCGNFRAVRDIGIAPIRKETVLQPLAHDGDKAYGMFNQLTIFSHNSSNNSGTANPDQDSDVDVIGNGGSLTDNLSRSAKLAEYATIIRQNNHKSLWNHLRETYFQTKKERRRRLDLDLITGVENAIWSAKSGAQSNSNSLPPRGASPTRNPAEVQAGLYRKAQQLSSSGIGPVPPKTSQHFRPISISTHLNVVPRIRRVVIDGRQRKAFAKAIIPLTVCFLEPQQVADNRASVCHAPSSSVSDLPVFPTKAPGILLPCSEKDNVNPGLDLVIAPELLSHLHDDDSPDETILPIRTCFLANQLRELLSSFNPSNSIANGGTTALSSQIIAATSSATVTTTAGDGNYRVDRSISTEHRMERAQTTRCRPWVKRVEARGRGVSAGCRSSDSMETVVRSRSASVPEDAGRTQSPDCQTSSTFSQLATSMYPQKFTVQSVEHVNEEAEFLKNNF